MTRVEEYEGGAAEPYRTTPTGYCPKLTVWILDKPSFVNTYEGLINVSTPSPEQLRASTQYIYHGNTSPDWNVPVGDLGELRGVRRLRDGDLPYEFADTRYWYDAYGNVTTETTYRGYGTGNG